LNKPQLSPWLKKYTKMSFLHPIILGEELHLADPATWEDKNDIAVLKLYAERRNFQSVRVTCLNQGTDKYHFWSIYGDKERGICLWFDRKSLLKDIKNDSSLISGSISYRAESETSAILVDQVAFQKRKQYEHEREFRIIRRFEMNEPITNGLKFSPLTLRKIFLNPWLSNGESSFYKDIFGQMLPKSFSHVQILQNRSLDKSLWVSKVTRAIKDP
jgi:Protein of unknown function (DUF2971)